MKEKICRYFQDWNSFEKGYVITGLVLTLLTTFICKGDLLQLVYSVSFMMNAILLSKGRVECYFFALAGILAYVIISFRQHYYGEVIINACLYLPMSIYGLTRWLKSTSSDGHTVKINYVTRKEIITAISTQAVMVFAYYMILKAFNTDNLILGVISIAFSVLANYFEMRISIWSLYFFIGVDTTIAVMWLIPILQGQISLLPVIVAPLLLLVSDVYGTVNWRKLEKSQKDEP